MSAVVARVAQTGDLADIVRLDHGLRKTLAGLRGGNIYLLRNHRPSPTDTSYGADIDDRDKLVVIGLVKSYPAGFGVVGLSWLGGGYVLAEVTELFVEEDMRGVGLGKAMMDLLIDWARSNGADGIDSQAMPGDRDTKNFFEGNGMVTRALYLHMDLDRR